MLNASYLGIIQSHPMKSGVNVAEYLPRIVISGGNMGLQ